MTATLPSTAADPVERPVDPEEFSARLLGSSAEKSYDPVVDIDLAARIPTQLYGLSSEWSTSFGTPSWDSSSSERRVTLTCTSTADLRRRFQSLLVPLVLSDVDGDDPARPHVRWAQTEIADDAGGRVRPHGTEVRRAEQRFRSRPTSRPRRHLVDLGGI